MKILSCFLLLISGACFGQQTNKEAIIDEFCVNCAWHHSYYSPEWQECLDAGLKKDSTAAYLWQQKAMPYFKRQKFETAMKYLDKAVFYDKKSWLAYRAYLKCIFVKNHREAIADFSECISLYGNNYEMDHSYRFYIALSYLQLEEIDKAEAIWADDIAVAEGDAHQLDIFYYGIVKYEQKQWDAAIAQFDSAIGLYPEFSDAKYYKSICLRRLGQEELADKLYAEAKLDFENGYTITEDNVIYEKYPYQVTYYR